MSQIRKDIWTRQKTSRALARPALIPWEGKTLVCAYGRTSPEMLPPMAWIESIRIWTT